MHLFDRPEQLSIQGYIINEKNLCSAQVLNPWPVNYKFHVLTTELYGSFCKIANKPYVNGVIREHVL